MCDLNLKHLIRNEISPFVFLIVIYDFLEQSIKLKIMFIFPSDREKERENRNRKREKGRGKYVEIEKEMDREKREKNKRERESVGTLKNIYLKKQVITCSCTYVLYLARSGTLRDL